MPKSSDRMGLTGLSLCRINGMVASSAPPRQRLGHLAVGAQGFNLERRRYKRASLLSDVDPVAQRVGRVSQRCIGRRSHGGSAGKIGASDSVGVRVAIDEGHVSGHVLILSFAPPGGLHERPCDVDQYNSMPCDDGHKSSRFHINIVICAVPMQCPTLAFKTRHDLVLFEFNCQGASSLGVRPYR